MKAQIEALEKLEKELLREMDTALARQINSERAVKQAEKCCARLPELRARANSAKRDFERINQQLDPIQNTIDAYYRAMKQQPVQAQAVQAQIVQAQTVQAHAGILTQQVMEQITQFYLADNYPLLKNEQGQEVTITSPETVFALVKWMNVLPQEHIRVLMLNVRHKVIGMTCAAVGTVNEATVVLRDVFRPAVRSNAFGVILVHNHPSGDPTPSDEDIALTKRAVDAGNLLGVKVLDHIIVGQEKYVSLRENHLVTFN